MMKKWLVTLLALGYTLISFIAVAESPKVKLETTVGDIVLQLNSEAAPETVANFLLYVEEGFYDGTIFHRTIMDFMIQGGGYTADLVKKDTRTPIENEADNGLKNIRGSIAMARTGDPHSATAQFFINTVDNAFLDYSAPSSRGWGYAVFGEVIQGMEIVDDISEVQTSIMGGFSDVPLETIFINKASLISEDTDENLSDMGSLFALAENIYSEYFSPAGAETFELAYDGAIFQVRYYADTNTYLGVSGEDVYVYGDVFGGLLNVGVISDYVDTSN